ncbi:MAG: helix-turn-helix transcriptional regulator [Defluviitaleaceae bacterium]|nr:helix-turn-helix transcriptional regulator [Defluviitaleaceae bacterium]
MDKYKLLDEALSTNFNDDKEVLESVKNRLQDYLKKEGNDVQIENTLCVIQSFLLESERNDFEACRQVTSPVFERSQNPEKWDFYDLRILGRIVDYAGTYRQTYELSENILEKLENYSHEERYNKVKIAVYMNTMSRMLRAKYLEADNLAACEELEENFSEYFDAIMEISEKCSEFAPHRAATIIRKGVFHRNESLKNEGFSELKRMGEHGVYRLLEETVSEYAFLQKRNVSKKQLAKTIGVNLRKLRKEHKMTLSGLGKAVELSLPYVGMLERGERSPSAYALGKICNFFGVEVSYFYGNGEAAGVSNEKDAQLSLLNGYAQKLSVQQVKFLVDMAKNFPNPGV